MIDPEIDLSAYLKWLCSLGIRCNEVPELVSKINGYAFTAFRLNSRVWLGSYRTDLSKRLIVHFDAKKAELQSRLEVIEDDYIRYIGSMPGTVYISDDEETKEYQRNIERFSTIIKAQSYFLPTSEEVEVIQELRLSGFISKVEELNKTRWFRPKNQLYQQKLDSLLLLCTACYNEGEPLSNGNRIAALNDLIKDVWAYDFAVYLRALLLPGNDAETAYLENIQRVSESLVIGDTNQSETEEYRHPAPARIPAKLLKLFFDEAIKQDELLGYTNTPNSVKRFGEVHGFNGQYFYQNSLNYAQVGNVAELSKSEIRKLLAFSEPYPKTKRAIENQIVTRK